jgi:prephenate dehydratase
MQRFNLKGLWAYTIADGRGKVGCVPQNAKRFIDTAEKLGLTTNESVAFYVSGSDKVGALCKVLDRLDKASVNVKVMDAMGFSGRYGAYVWVDPQEVESAAKALGA